MTFTHTRHNKMILASQLRHFYVDKFDRLANRKQCGIMFKESASLH